MVKRSLEDEALDLLAEVHQVLEVRVLPNMANTTDGVVAKDVHVRRMMNCIETLLDGALIAPRVQDRIEELESQLAEAKRLNSQRAQVLEESA